MVVTVGETTTVEPAPTEYAPHEYQYHFQVSALPKLPPVKLSVDDEPVVIVDGVAEAELAVVEFEQTVTVLLTQVVVLHAP